MWGGGGINILWDFFRWTGENLHFLLQVSLMSSIRSRDDDFLVHVDKSIKQALCILKDLLKD